MKLKRKYKLGYGMLSIADQCLYFMFGTFFLFFLTTVVGINPVIAGIIASVGAVWDAISALIVGHFSDNCNSKLGKRRPFILYTAVPMAIVTVLLFTNIECSIVIKICYYFLMTLLFWTGFSMFFIPILAWGAELTDDYDERTNLRGFAYGGNTLGMAIGTVMPTLLVDYFMNTGHTVSRSWQIATGVVGLIVILVLFLGLFLLKNHKDVLLNKNLRKTENDKMVNRVYLIDEIKEILNSSKEVIKMPSLFLLILGSILYLGANTIFVADRMYYYTFNMQLNPREITWLMMIEPFAGIIFLPFIYFLSRKLDKRSQYILGMSICGISMIALRLVEVDTFVKAGYMLIGFGLGAICYWQLMPAMIYDVCELDRLKTGKERQGAIVSLQVFSESTSEAIGLVLLGILLHLSGFDGNTVNQSDEALFQVSNAFTLIPGIFMIGSSYMIYKYPITRENFYEIQKLLSLKDKGEAAKLGKFKKF